MEQVEQKRGFRKSFINGTATPVGCVMALLFLIVAVVYSLLKLILQIAAGSVLSFATAAIIFSIWSLFFLMLVVAAIVETAGGLLPVIITGLIRDHWPNWAWYGTRKIYNLLEEKIDEGDYLFQFQSLQEKDRFDPLDPKTWKE